MDKKVIDLRRNMRRTELRLKEYCANQVPSEIFHYTLSQMRAIDTLYSLTREFGGIQLKMLAESLNITPAAASEMVDTLVRKGAIIRKPDPEDRRAVRLFVGDSLLERFESCEKKLNIFTEKFLATLSADEADNFISVVAKLAEFASEPENLPEVEK